MEDRCTLSKSDLERYDRQLLIPDWGKNGQKKLKCAKVVVAGTGGLGCPASLYLTAAGIGKLIIIDNEKFELSNLNRQILGWHRDIGRPKTEVVVQKLKEVNPEIEIKAHNIKITEQNIGVLLKDVDVVVDGMDNWKTRFIINRECVKRMTPFVHAGVFGLYGQIMTVVPGKGPCLRCLLPKTPKEITRFPVTGATPGLFGILQVTETLKLIIGFGKSLVGRLLLFDGENMRFTILNVERRQTCPVCSHL